MTLPTQYAISLSDVNVELKKAASAAISMNDTNARTLAGKPAGIISMSDFYGKSNGVNASFSPAVFNYPGDWYYLDFDIRPGTISTNVYIDVGQHSASNASYMSVLSLNSVLDTTTSYSFVFTNRGAASMNVSVFEYGTGTGALSLDLGPGLSTTLNRVMGTNGLSLNVTCEEGIIMQGEWLDFEMTINGGTPARIQIGDM